MPKNNQENFRKLAINFFEEDIDTLIAAYPTHKLGQVIRSIVRSYVKNKLKGEKKND